jgi:hypothetical protein
MLRKNDPLCDSGVKTSSCTFSAISLTFNEAVFIEDKNIFNRLKRIPAITQKYMIDIEAIRPQMTSTRSRSEDSSNKIPPHIKFLFVQCIHRSLF